MAKKVTIEDAQAFELISRTYKKVLVHRRNCDKWGTSFCLDCFGGGLTQFAKDLQSKRKQ